MFFSGAEWLKTNNCMKFKFIATKQVGKHNSILQNCSIGKLAALNSSSFTHRIRSNWKFILNYVRRSVQLRVLCMSVHAMSIYLFTTRYPANSIFASPSIHFPMKESHSVLSHGIRWESMVVYMLGFLDEYASNRTLFSGTIRCSHAYIIPTHHM